MALAVTEGAPVPPPLLLERVERWDRLRPLPRSAASGRKVRLHTLRLPFRR
jgi:hypothetical protein